jgi:hypothetical protein
LEIRGKGERWIPVDVIWCKKGKGERKKGENCKGKGRMKMKGKLK